MDSERYLNKSTLRALHILESFTNEPDGLSISGLARKIEMHKSTAHRFVVTLEKEGWLRKINGSDRFTFGIKLAVLGRVASTGAASWKIIRPDLENLSRHTGETVVLSVLDHFSAICVDKIDSSKRLNISSEVGQSFPLHAGATGFAVLLAMSPEQVRRILFAKPLKSFTSLTETDPKKVFENYLRLKHQGYVVSSGNVDPGVTAVAAPLTFSYENSYGSIGVVLPDNRAEVPVLEKFIDAVRQAASEINRKLA